MKGTSLNNQVSYRHFKNLLKQLRKSIASGNFLKLSQEEANRILKRIHCLYEELKAAFSSRKLARMLASSGLIIAMGATQTANAQSFDTVEDNPFGLSGGYIISTLAFADMDNDGDQDLFIGQYGEAYSLPDIIYYENTGTAEEPSFTLVPGAFDFGVSSILAAPELADLDNDGDFDMLIGLYTYDYDGDFYYFENTGTPEAASFGPAQINPFGINPVAEFAFPALVDIDDDGDLDLFSGSYAGPIFFMENTGSASSPAFASQEVNPFGIIFSTEVSDPEFADLDGDGDFDLMIGAYEGVFYYLENQGSASDPEFALPVSNPFGLTPVYYYAFPSFVDIDNDGDLDLFAGEYYQETSSKVPYLSNINYFENISEPVSAQEPAATQEFGLALFPNPVADQLQITFKIQKAGKIHLRIIDMEGRQILNQSFRAQAGGNHKSIMLEDLASGNYILELITSDKTITKKFIRN